jgi:hypothetical protein
VIGAVLDAEAILESTEAASEAPTNEGVEDPSLEQSTDTERTGLDDEDAVTAPVGIEAPPTPGLVTISDILGVPLFYERISAPGPRSFPVASSFHPTLVAIVKQLQERAPAGFGSLKQISSAGMFVGKPGAHGEGRGCDWDRLVFTNVQIAPIEQHHRSPSNVERMRYWAFGAICRSNCAFVLHGLYDDAHADHYHTDNMTGIAFNRDSEATVKLLQAVLNDIHDHTPKLEVDGDYGSLSSSAFARAMDQLQLTGSIDDVDVWRRFLRRSARLGFVRSLGV